MIDNETLRRTFLVRYPQRLSVGNEFDGAVLTRAINSVSAQPIGKSVRYLRAGMANADFWWTRFSRPMP